MKPSHIIGGVEIFILAALPAWMQSSTGTSFLHSHMAVADVIAAAYVGFRAVNLALKANPTQPAKPEN